MDWEPYRPPWYPADARTPFTMNGDTGPAAQSNYADWVDELERKQGPGALEQLVAEHRQEQG
jgi:hypothetical protein